ncbi:MAG: anti-sigma factor antagonist [Mycobacterium sp.]|nr:anti-sigma factor antagonist [Mycobacterium sp.]
MLLEDPIASSIETRDGVAVLAVRGEIDVASAPAFKSAIAEALEGNPEGLVLNLLEVEFLGSVGVRVLLEAQGKIGDGRFAVVARSPAAGRILQLLSLDELLSVHSTVDEALSWMAAA